MDAAERLLDALRAMGRRGAAIGRPSGYGTPQSGYRTPFGLWAIGYWREVKGEQQSCSLEDARGASYCLVDGAERL